MSLCRYSRSYALLFAVIRWRATAARYVYWETKVSFCNGCVRKLNFRGKINGIRNDVVILSLIWNRQLCWCLECCRKFDLWWSHFIRVEWMDVSRLLVLEDNWLWCESWRPQEIISCVFCCFSQLCWHYRHHNISQLNHKIRRLSRGIGWWWHVG